MRRVDPLDDEEIERLARVHEGRLESLLAVDEAVDLLLQRLESTGELDDTLVLYTSDNGFLEGEHRLEKKNVFYEESARVPLLIRGPGFPAGAVRSQATANVDLAPTILDAAGVHSRRRMDGRSLLPLAADGAAARGRGVLLENTGSVGVRTRRFMYARHPNGDEQELYDLRQDPFQLESLHADPDYSGTRRGLSRRLDVLDDCSGASCR